MKVWGAPKLRPRIPCKKLFPLLSQSAFLLDVLDPLPQTGTKLGMATTIRFLIYGQFLKLHQDTADVEPQPQELL